jgi:hypothetical protein
MTAVIAVAAAQRAAQQQHEEETMTPYSSSELAEHWEFKIIRSPTGRFRDPAFLKKTLDEESRAGWMLLEKFDNQRVRLKRPASARAQVVGRGLDPYRINVGSASAGVWIGLGLGLAISLLVIVGAYLFVAPHGR